MNDSTFPAGCTRPNPEPCSSFLTPLEMRAMVRRLAADGWRDADVQAVTGWSRDLVREAMIA